MAASTDGLAEMLGAPSGGEKRWYSTPPCGVGDGDVRDLGDRGLHLVERLLDAVELAEVDLRARSP